MRIFSSRRCYEKITKILCKAEDDVKRVLFENKDSLHLYDWTMSTKKDSEGKITKSRYLYFIHSKEKEINIEQRIDLFKYTKPEFCKEVFVADSYEDAKEMAGILLES